MVKKAKNVPPDFLSNVFARLREALTHWHRAAKAYAKPEEFRIDINACIQSLRNVTFVLQKQKANIHNFQEWYGQWQEALKKDVLMRWCVDARNTIVKQGDLKTKSIAKASLVASYLDAPINEFTVSPFTPTEIIADDIANKALSDELSKSGYLRVERQWVAENLTDVELLEALGHAFIILAKLVNDVIKQKGPYIAYSKVSDKSSTPEDLITQHDPHDIPQCMRAFAESRIIWLKLPTKKIVQVERLEVGSKSDIRETATRYRLSEFEDSKNQTPTTLKQSVEFFLKIGKRILEVDDHHNPTLILIDRKRRACIAQTAFEDQDDKYMFWNQLAQEVKRDKITEIIFIVETWLYAFDSKQPFRKAKDVSNKKEALQATGISCKGNEFCITAPFTNIDGKILFEENIETPSIGVSFLEPIKRVWGIS